MFTYLLLLVSSDCIEVYWALLKFLSGVQCTQSSHVSHLFSFEVKEGEKLVIHTQTHKKGRESEKKEDVYFSSHT